MNTYIFLGAFMFLAFYENLYIFLAFDDIQGGGGNLALFVLKILGAP